jgi:hypothetical protein
VGDAELAVYDVFFNFEKNVLPRRSIKEFATGVLASLRRGRSDPPHF